MEEKKTHHGEGKFRKGDADTASEYQDKKQQYDKELEKENDERWEKIMERKRQEAKKREKEKKKEDKRKAKLKKEEEKEKRKRKNEEDKEKKNKKKRCCGIQLSLLGIVICAWGTLQLALMGLFYYNEAMTLFHDLQMDLDLNKTAEEFYDEVSEKYKKAGICCWGASVVYLIALIACAIRHHYNLKHRKKLKAEKDRKKLK